MKPAAEIQAERLRAALTEACCDDCGTMSKKTGKKVCCADEKAKAPPSETGQNVPVRVEQKDKPKDKSKERPTTHPFVKRCVAAITKDDPNVERSELSRAFAICTAQMQKSPKAAKTKKKQGVPEDRVADYERALAQARGDE